jgi:predicted glutamine amidotransferase
MCRLLAVRDDNCFSIADQLGPFAAIARNSREYQGHGWGCAWLDDGEWRLYRSITPIWEDDLTRFGEARVLLAHARSAFRDEGIAVENNMPFLSGAAAFIFNGELRGVRIAAPGRIGAEKLFHFLLQVRAGEGNEATRHGVDIIIRRTRYIRAMNFVLAERGVFEVYSLFNEDRDYFTMHVRRAGSRLAVCSEPFPSEEGWMPHGNGVLEVFA